MASYKIHLPTLLSKKLGISAYVANTILHEAFLSLDDAPIPIKEHRDRVWLSVNDEDWGKKLTVKGHTNTYVVEVTNPAEDEDDFAR